MNFNLVGNYVWLCCFIHSASGHKQTPLQYTLISDMNEYTNYNYINYNYNKNVSISLFNLFIFVVMIMNETESKLKKTFIKI